MDDTIDRSRYRWWAVAMLAILAAIGVAIAAAGVTVWVLALAAALSVAAGFRSRAVGIAAGIVVPLATMAFAVRVFHTVGLGLGAGDILVLVAIVLAGLAAVGFGRGFRIPGRSAWWGALAAGAIPVAIGVIFAGLPLLRNGHALSWAMHNDAVWNLVTARFIVGDAGLIPSLHPNASPMTALLLAAGMAPGRSGASPTGLLQHDIAAMAGVFALSTVVTAFVAGLTVAEMVPAAHPLLRSIGAVLASALIASWFVAGFAFQFGFYNVMPTVACLLASWLAWRGVARTPVAAIAVLLAATTALLALWAFLAVIPLALAAAAALRWLIGRPRLRWPVWLVLAVAAVQVVAYVLLFSLPDLRRSQGSLAQGGSMAPVSPALLFVLAGLALAVAGATATRPERRADLVGIVAVAVPVVAVYLYLGRNVGADQYGWGYYPAKLVWFGGILLLVVLLGMTLDRIARVRLEVWPRVAAVTGALIALVAVAASVLPKPPTLGSLVPYLDIVHGRGVASGDPVLSTLFALDDPADARTLLVGYYDWRAEGFANLWLLGASAKHDGDPIRSFGYSLITDDRHQVCQALEVWGPGVTVRTKDSRLSAQLRSLCPQVGAHVVVGSVGASG